MSDDLVRVSTFRADIGGGLCKHDKGTWVRLSDYEEAADRISELEADLQEAEQRGYANAMEAERKLHDDRISELEKQNASLETKLAEAVKALEGSRETILQLINSLWSEAEGTDEDWVGDIDDTIAKIKGEQL